MYPILKPGAVVNIKQLQRHKESLTGGCFITREMAALSGARVKITSIYVYDDNPLKMRYFIDLDNEEHVWTIDFFSIALLKRKPL